MRRRLIVLGCVLGTATLKSLAAPSGARAERPMPDLAAEADISAAQEDKHGALVHTVRCPHQSDATKIRVLLPESASEDDKQTRFRVLYVLPVEAGDGRRFGDGLREVQKLGLHNKHRLICVAPTFAKIPWYADHPDDPALRQETYFLEVVVPFIEKQYHAIPRSKGRLLLGFSKSGWGAWSLLLRHADRFHRAAAWDAPLTMNAPGRYGSGAVFATQENFQKYHIPTLLDQRAGQWGGCPRLALLGYANFRRHHEDIHAQLTKRGVSHEYRDGPRRGHTWSSGWVEQAVQFLAQGKIEEPASKAKAASRTPD